MNLTIATDHNWSIDSHNQMLCEQWGYSPQLIRLRPQRPLTIQNLLRVHVYRPETKVIFIKTRKSIDSFHVDLFHDISFWQWIQKNILSYLVKINTTEAKFCLSSMGLNFVVWSKQCIARFCYPHRCRNGSENFPTAHYANPCAGRTLKTMPETMTHHRNVSSGLWAQEDQVLWHQHGLQCTE